MLLLLAAGCTTVGAGGKIDDCAGRGALRFSQSTIEKMTDEEVRAALAHNDASAAIGCSAPNQ